MHLFVIILACILRVSSPLQTPRMVPQTAYPRHCELLMFVRVKLERGRDNDRGRKALIQLGLSSTLSILVLFHFHSRMEFSAFSHFSAQLWVTSVRTSLYLAHVMTKNVDHLFCEMHISSTNCSLVPLVPLVPLVRPPSTITVWGRQMNFQYTFSLSNSVSLQNIRHICVIGMDGWHKWQSSWPSPDILTELKVHTKLGSVCFVSRPHQYLFFGNER